MAEAGRNGGFETTEGLHLLWELAGQPENVVLRALDGELDGMEYYESEYRWPAVHGSNGSVTVTVPRAGAFYAGVVVYERSEPDAELSFEMSLDGEVVGSFFPNERDNRQRLYFLTHPVAFKGGERITVRTGGKGFHLIEDILLLRMKPPVRKRRLAIRNFEAAFSRRVAEDALRLTWITTWPAACRIEYETGGQTSTVEEETTLANHRVYLTDLDPGASYRCRIIAPTPNGGEVRSEEVVVPFAEPTVFTAGVERASVPLSVENPYDFAVEGYPVTSGIPFAAGELGDAENLRLTDADGKSVPVQAEVTGRWRDGSAKWVLLSFRADVSADSTAQYALEYGPGVSREEAPTPLAVMQDGDRVSVGTGPIEVEFDAGLSGFPVGVRLDGQDVLGEPIEAGIVAGDGVEYGSSGPAEHLEVEEAGPVRAVVHSRGHHRSDRGDAFFAYEARFVFTAGSPFFRVYYAWGNDEAELFSYWDLRIPKAVERKVGWRIDLILTTEVLAAKSLGAWIDVDARLAERPSDHTFVTAEFAI